jgi:hypothetical protein
MKRQTGQDMGVVVLRQLIIPTCLKEGIELVTKLGAVLELFVTLLRTS